MSRNDYVLSLLNQGQDFLVVVRPHPLRCQLQALSSGRGDIVAPPPNMHLILTPLLPSIILVEPTKFSIVTFVKSLILVDWDVLLTDLLELDAKGGLGALKGRGEGNVEFDTRGSNAFGTGKGFFATEFGESGVFPAGEKVKLVPFGLTVTGENEGADHFERCFFSVRKGKRWKMVVER